MLEILDHQSTPLGELCLRRRRLLSRPEVVVTEVTLDHGLLMSDLHTQSERRLATGALARLPERPLRVLVGGLGLGFTAAEALRDPRVARCTVIEFLPAVLDWWRRGLHAQALALREEPRLHLRQDDVFRFFAAAPGEERFDAILLDVDHDPEALLAPENAAFYTAEGLRAACAHLVPDGVLATWSTSANDAFAATLREVCAEVAVESVRFWNELVDEEKVDTLFFGRVRR
ncbi:MAG: spermidine synthase [Planctomycetes bacterium]|nr:spermidine synthase [Planctomycetota bacterium]